MSVCITKGLALAAGSVASDTCQQIWLTV